MRDGSQDEFLASVLSEYFDSGLSLDTKGFAKGRDVMVAEYNKRLSKRKSYGKPPPSR